MAGTVILGRAKGGIHEIGRALVSTLLAANGFRVYDLGADASGETFAAKVRDLRADIVGVSILLTTTMKDQKTVIEALEREGLRGRVKVMPGGRPPSAVQPSEAGQSAAGSGAR